jgi:hypothetical protein
MLWARTRLLAEETTTARYPHLAECRAVLDAVPRVPGAYKQHHIFMQALDRNLAKLKREAELNLRIMEHGTKKR